MIVVPEPADGDLTQDPSRIRVSDVAGRRHARQADRGVVDVDDRFGG